ncbi:hypothetical protein ACX84T_09330 [Burkholderia pseudomallei]
MKEPVRYLTTHPFTIETLQRVGEPPRYVISRAKVGGRYSDELLKREDAELLLHTLTREEADKEQLRYRIWQLEQANAKLLDSLKEARQHITHHSMCAAESEFNKACDCRRGRISAVIEQAEAVLSGTGA